MSAWFQSSPGPHRRLCRPMGFNPRPALAGRASRTTRPTCAAPRSFQSSPGPRGPGVFANTGEENEQTLVSILARPSRAGRRADLDEMTALCPFQSSPGPRGPGVLADQVDAGWKAVSILARPSRAGRLICHGCESMNSPFQSSPGPRGPGVPNPARSPAPRWGFNPRPALAGRASLVHFMCDSGGHVSILARPSRAGRPVKVVPSSRR